MSGLCGGVRIIQAYGAVNRGVGLVKAATGNGLCMGSGRNS